MMNACISTYVPDAHTKLWFITEESAETEPAWTGVGQEVGLKIWRIVVSVMSLSDTRE